MTSQSDDAMTMGPNSARNTVSHVGYQVDRNTMLANSQVFANASSNANKNKYIGYRSQSLIDLDSVEAKSH